MDISYKRDTCCDRTARNVVSFEVKSAWLIASGSSFKSTTSRVIFDDKIEPLTTREIYAKISIT